MTVPGFIQDINTRDSYRGVIKYTYGIDKLGKFQIKSHFICIELYCKNQQTQSTPAAQ